MRREPSTERRRWDVMLAGDLRRRASSFATVEIGAIAIVFALGIALRLIFLVLYHPAFLGDPDGGSYLYAAAHRLFGNVYDAAGYPLLVRIVHALSPHLVVLIALQHLLAVATAAILLLAVRLVTGSALLGLLPAAIVLFNGFGLWVEHTPITETWFTLVVVGALYLLLRGSGGSVRLAASAGALVGLSTTVRPVAVVLVPVLATWNTSRSAPGVPRRAAAASAVILPALAVLAGYVILQDARTGFVGLSPDSGRVLYARSAGFADCRKFVPPAGTAGLCERIPPARRGSPNQYLTGYPDHAKAVTAATRLISPAWRVFGPPPAGNGKLLAFGLTAIAHQPLDYLRAMARDFATYWADDHSAFISSDARAVPDNVQIATAYYASAPPVTPPPDFLRWYGEHVQVEGVLIVLLLLAPIPAIVLARGPARAAAILLGATGWALPLAADAAATVDPRYLLPALGPLAAAGAIALGLIRSPPGARTLPAKGSG